MHATSLAVVAEMEATYNKRVSSRAAYLAAKPEVEIDGRIYPVISTTSNGDVTFMVGESVGVVSVWNLKVEGDHTYSSPLVHGWQAKSLKLLPSVDAARAAAAAVWGI